MLIKPQYLPSLIIWLQVWRMKFARTQHSICLDSARKWIPLRQCNSKPSHILPMDILEQWDHQLVILQMFLHTADLGHNQWYELIKNKHLHWRKNLKIKANNYFFSHDKMDVTLEYHHKEDRQYFRPSMMTQLIVHLKKINTVLNTDNTEHHTITMDLVVLLDVVVLVQLVISLCLTLLSHHHHHQEITTQTTQVSMTAKKVMK